MKEIIIAIFAAIVAVVLYRWYTARNEGAENGPSLSGTGVTFPPTSSIGSDFGGVTGKQVYLMNGDAVTTDANGIHTEGDMVGDMTVSDLDDTRRKVLNPMERSKKSQRALSDRLMMDEMHRNSDGKKMAMGDEEYDSGMDCIQSILSPEDIVPGYIPGRLSLVSLAMSE